MTFSFESLGLLPNIGLFAVGALAVWRAGFRISQLANVISAKTGLGQALLGVLLLGGVTSLPELATSLTAAIGDNVALAVNNILGGVALQVAILAVADFLIKRRALTAVVPDPIVLLQGSLNIALLAIVAAAVMVSDIAVAGIGLWSWGILAGSLASFWILSQAEQRKPWIPANLDRGAKKADDSAKADRKPAGNDDDTSLGGVVMQAALTAAVILVAGYVVTRSAETIAEATGLGSSFVGAVLVAFSTSLPEVSTVFAAVRLGLYTMAISDILGTNLFDLMLLFVIDATAGGPPALTTVGTFASVAASLGILLTALYMIGLSERRDATYGRLGIDSIAVIVAYLGGVALLFTLR